MELTEAQKQTVGQWVNEGCGLSEIQRRLSGEFGISMTFMDVRFLVIDLGLQVRDKQTDSPSGASMDAFPSTEASETDFEGLESDQPASLAGLGAVVVEVDRVMKPGSVVSGSVRFSDGKSARWFLDRFGRLALDAGKPGYMPSEQDLQIFQQELKRELEKRGF